MTTPFKPLVLMPSYNTGGDLLLRTASSVLDTGNELFVVIDGSTDGSDAALSEGIRDPRLRILRLVKNRGKGHAIRTGAAEAQRLGYTHALAMDADGQHPAERIGPMLDQARNAPEAMVLGQPVFGPEAPWARVHGRKLSTFWTNFETLWCGLGDSLFGMRVYPLQPLLAAFHQTAFARGFEFDPEIAVRMAWAGCRPLQCPVPVRYLALEEGGVSHFHYLRDNFKLTLLHFRLVPEFVLFRILPMIAHKRKWKCVS